MSTVIVGGGIIGLSIAYELANRGHEVTLLERDRFGQKASWAGAGILTPAGQQSAIHPLEQLELLSHSLHEQWSADLIQQTGIDNGFVKCGGLYVARTAGEAAALAGVAAEWADRGIEHQSVEPANLKTRFGSLAASLGRAKILSAIWVPGESQFSNPDQIAALVAACRKLGVSLNEDLGELVLRFGIERVDAVEAEQQSFAGQHYIFCGGPWTEAMLAPAGISLPMHPVRGQIALYKIDSQSSDGEAVGPIINEGSRYLVPRRDGHVLAGATIEEVGFDCRTTDAEVDGLRQWAEGLSRQLHAGTFVKSWAGLRPGTYDGFPYIGPIGGWDNAWVATGHFKSGLYLSTGTAVMVADLVEGKTPTIDLSPFAPARANDHQSTEIR